MVLSVVGATGLVGRTFLSEIARKKIKYDKINLYASAKSDGKTLFLKGKKLKVKALTESFEAGDYVLLSAGGEVSKKYVPLALKQGATVIDNSGFWRMHKDVPLVIPEVNFCDVGGGRLIANPNCSTACVIAAVNALKKWGVKSLRYVTFQSVSGAGRAGLKDLRRCQKGKAPAFFAHNIAKTCIPQIGDFCKNGYTVEERKMINETRKILHIDKLPVSATCVRVPVPYCHAAAVFAELDLPFQLSAIRRAFFEAEGLTLADDTTNNLYPLFDSARFSEKSFVGRIRKDAASKNGVTFYCVADNLYKGAASNAVEILKRLVDAKGLL